MNTKNSDSHIVVVMHSLYAPYLYTKENSLCYWVTNFPKVKKILLPFTQNVCLSRSDKIE